MVSSSTDQRGPLPHNWEIGYTENGEKYFIDHNTGSTQWEDPRDLDNVDITPLIEATMRRGGGKEIKIAYGGAGGDESAELPEGWERVEDEQHGVFYVDHVNKRTQYEHPSLTLTGQTANGGRPPPMEAPIDCPPSRMRSSDAGMKAVMQVEAIDKEEGSVWVSSTTRSDDAVWHHMPAASGFNKHQQMEQKGASSSSSMASTASGQPQHNTATMAPLANSGSFASTKSYPAPQPMTDGPNKHYSHQGVYASASPPHHPQHGHNSHPSHHYPPPSANYAAIVRPLPVGHNGQNGGAGGHPQFVPPVARSQPLSQHAYHLHQLYTFTTDPAQLRGELLTARIQKGSKGLGFTLIGNDGTNAQPEFIQIKSVIPGGPAAAENTLHTGDVLVYVGNECMLGATQDDACRVFRGIGVGEWTTLQVCRGYPLLLDPGVTRVVTENVYSEPMGIPMGLPRHTAQARQQLEIEIKKGARGFGFTITDSLQGQRVKSVLAPDQCPNLLEGDVILEVDGRNVRAMAHSQLVQMLQECPVGSVLRMQVGRHAARQYRSRTPTAGFRYYAPGEQRGSSQPPEMPPPFVGNLYPANAVYRGGRSRTPAPNNSPSVYGNYGITGEKAMMGTWDGRNIHNGNYGSSIRPSCTSLGFSSTPNYVTLSALLGATNGGGGGDLVTVNILRRPDGFGFRLVGGEEMGTALTVGAVIHNGAAHADGRLREGDQLVEIDGKRVEAGRHDRAVELIRQAAGVGHVKLVVRRRNQQQPTQHRQCQPPTTYETASTLTRQPVGTYDDSTLLHSTTANMANLHVSTPPRLIRRQSLPPDEGGFNGDGSAIDPSSSGKLIKVALRRGTKGFGFSIRGGWEFDRMPLYVLRIADDGPAAMDGRLRVGDQLLEINGRSCGGRDGAGEDEEGMSHEEAIQLIKERDTVQLMVKRVGDE